MNLNGSPPSSVTPIKCSTISIGIKSVNFDDGALTRIDLWVLPVKVGGVGVELGMESALIGGRDGELGVGARLGGTPGGEAEAARWGEE